MKLPKLITGGAAEIPISAEVTGISKSAPPPPDMVEITKAIIPAKNSPARCQLGIACKISSTVKLQH